MRIRLLGAHYDRPRDLPCLVPEFADRAGAPFSGLSPDAVIANREQDAAFTRRVGRTLTRHLSRALRQRTARDVEARIDQLRVALAGELRLYRRQRRDRLPSPSRFAQSERT